MPKCVGVKSIWSHTERPQQVRFVSLKAERNYHHVTRGGQRCGGQPSRGVHDDDMYMTP